MEAVVEQRDADEYRLQQQLRMAAAPRGLKARHLQVNESVIRLGDDPSEMLRSDGMHQAELGLRSVHQSSGPRTFHEISREASDQLARLAPLGQHFERVFRSLPQVRGVISSLSKKNNNHEQFRSLLSLLPGSASPAIYSLDGDKPPLSHQDLCIFIERKFEIRSFGIGKRSRVAVLLPDSPMLAVTLLGLMSWCVCAPLNPNSTIHEIRSAVERLHLEAVVCKQEETAERLGLFRELQVTVITLVEALDLQAGVFTMEGAMKKEGMALGVEKPGPQDEVLILQTSGTSGVPKIVTYTLEALVIGAACVASSWMLTPKDLGLNMMPLFHVGGIVRNLLSPILVGGGTICGEGFDAIKFVKTISSRPVSWYYATPTMHNGILNEYERFGPRPMHSISLICNAGGGLLPSLAVRLQKAFGSCILPSYGMTECMPISSPPRGYKLERPGTSGLPVGPEVAIFDDSGAQVQIGVEGNIVVRGPPLFREYENDATATAAAFDANGWFSTGDRGSLDIDGYLFITGRSKEVIKRGGEMIAPAEIEEVLVKLPRIAQVLAFSAPHEVLQETVGIVLVMKPGATRIDLVELQQLVVQDLHPSKWPFVIVYMNDLPKNSINKVLRIKLSERLSMPMLSDDMSANARLFEAVCPPKTVPLSSPIQMNPVKLLHEECLRIWSKHCFSFEVLDSAVGRDDRKMVVAAVQLAKFNTIEWEAQQLELLEVLRNQLHDYSIPKKIVVFSSGSVIPRNKNGSLKVELAISLDEVAMAVNSQVSKEQKALQSSLVDIFQRVLMTSVGLDDDFFQIGGSSMKAGLLFSLINEKFKTNLPISVIYQHRTVRSFGDFLAVGGGKQSPAALQHRRRVFVDEWTYQPQGRSKVDNAPSVHIDASSPVVKQGKPQQHYFHVMLFQLIPLVFVEPLRMSIKWVAFMQFLDAFVGVFGQQNIGIRYAHLFLAMLLVRIAVGVIFPWIGILSKWILVGRMKAGKYPLWGWMYLRWWLANQCVSLWGIGLFRLTGTTRIWYYKLLGAGIGKNVKINSQTILSEWDLISIGDDCIFDSCTLRPMYLEPGNLLLSPIILGEGCVVGRQSQIAPGASVPPNTVIGPLSSSYEVDDAAYEYAALCRANFPGPHWLLQLFVGWPIVIVVEIAALLPWAGVMFFALNVVFFTATGVEPSILLLFIWFTQLNRLYIRVAAQVAHRLLSPFVRLLLGMLVKKLMRPIGWRSGRTGKDAHARDPLLSMQQGEELPEGGDNTMLWPRDMSQRALLRKWLVEILLPGKGLLDVPNVVGTHYEIVSCIYRALGAKVGKRVYWPGSGIETSDYDLINIGNDVVFGSRSHIFCVDGLNEGHVTVKDGAMIADRCVLCPGVEIGRNTIMGSGALGKKGTVYPPDTVWIGSVNGGAEQWDTGGGARSSEVGDTKSPFGRAFYDRSASFFVFPLWLIIVFNVVIEVFTAIFWFVPINAAAWFVVALYFSGNLPVGDVNTGTLLGLIFGFLCGAVPLLAFIALMIDIIMKWCLIGRRKVGSYDWDQSSYCQRWQLHLALHRIRARGPKNGVLNYLLGSEWLCIFFRMMGARIAKNVCLYPAGADPMMTEPDLVDVKEGACIDDASLVCHINTKGHFALNKLEVGRGAVMRFGSRLLSGASMGDYSTLLEHTLMPGGAIVPPGSVWQGWPAQEVFVDEGLHE
jgi:acyl-CoA synthetase (AMP-forming)/AMP-acid ligase II/acetyltransferase-like isoleucine patch superfamily enzyme